MPRSPRRLLDVLCATAVVFSLAAFSGCSGESEPDTGPAVENGSTSAPTEGGGVANNQGSSTGQGDSKPQANTSTDKPNGAPAGDAGPSTAANFTPLKEKVKFKTDGGDTIISFKAESDGAKAVDSNENEVARFNVREARIKIKRADDSEVGNIRITPTRLKIESPDDKKLFELQRQDDGDWKLDDAEEKLVYRIKKRDYGYEIEDAQETSLYKIKLKGAKLSIRDAGDQTVMATKNQFPPLAAAALFLNEIRDPALRYGIAIAFALEVDSLKP